MKRVDKIEHSINRLFSKKIKTSIIFMFFLFIFAIVNFKYAYKPIIDSIKRQNISYCNVNESRWSLEAAINENFYLKNVFVDIFSYVQNLMNKNEERNFEVVKDSSGILHYTSFADKPNYTDEILARVKTFKTSINNGNVKFIYLMAPDKFIKGYTKFEMGIPYNYANETADNFIEGLKENNIDTLDLRKVLDGSEIEIEEVFYKTDENWKIETSFWAFKELINKLNNDYKMSLDEDGFYRNAENYNFIKYEGSYIGSMGRKTGKYYSGAEDFTLVYPKFKTSYSFSSKMGEQLLNLDGRFEDALILKSSLRNEKDLYSLESGQYTTYLYGNSEFAHIHNKSNEKGPKVLFIKDSSATPMAAFFSTVCSDVYLIDPRYYKDDISAFINQTQLDFVFMSSYPQNLSSEFISFLN